MQKVMLPVSKEELLNALAQLSEQELETLIKELRDIQHAHRISPIYVRAEEVEGLSGV